MAKQQDLPGGQRLLMCGGRTLERLIEALKKLANSAPRKHVLLSTDAGVDCDDQVVIAYLALSQRFKLVGIVSCHAPNVPEPHGQVTFNNINEVLDAMPLSKRPTVCQGSNHPLASMQEQDGCGADFIVEASRGYSPSNRLAVVLIGAATDLAAAMRKDPTLADRIEVIAMGFNDWPLGTDGFNIQNDIPAWQIVLGSSAPITVGSGDLCKKHLMATRELVDGWFGNGKPGRYLARCYHDWVAAHSDQVVLVTGSEGMWPIWDIVVLAYLLGFSQSKLYERPTLNDDTSFTHAHEPPRELDETATTLSLRWITSIDQEALWTELSAQFEAAGQQWSKRNGD